MNKEEPNAMAKDSGGRAGILRVFNFCGTDVRAVEIDGEPWFVGRDVAAALGYEYPSKAVIDHVYEDDRRIFQSSQNSTFVTPESDEDGGKAFQSSQNSNPATTESGENGGKAFQSYQNSNFETLESGEDGGKAFQSSQNSNPATTESGENGGKAFQSYQNSNFETLESGKTFQSSQNGNFEIPNRGLTIINEPGLYALIFGSKLESAKTFKRWVTAEVLPEIRRTGGYGAANLDKALADALKEAESKAACCERELLEAVSVRNALRVIARKGKAMLNMNRLFEMFFDERVDIRLGDRNFRTPTHELYRMFCDYAGVGLGDDGKPLLAEAWTLAAFTRAVVSDYPGVRVRQVKVGGYPVQFYIGLMPHLLQNGYRPEDIRLISD